MPREEVSRAFRLFTGGDARPICVRDVAAVAEELGIKMSSEELEEMVLQVVPLLLPLHFSFPCCLPPRLHLPSPLPSFPLCVQIARTR